MAKRPPKSQPTWINVKKQLMGFDRTGLVSLIQDLYDASRDNQTFLHTRFGLGANLLAPYKKTIARWISPNVYSENCDISVSKAKQALSDYKKAIGDPAGLAELMVFYCERASSFCADFGNDDAGYFDALVNVFAQALNVASSLPDDVWKGFFLRLQDVKEASKFGYWVPERMGDLLLEYETFDDDTSPEEP